MFPSSLSCGALSRKTRRRVMVTLGLANFAQARQIDPLCLRLDLLVLAARQTFLLPVEIETNQSE